MKRNIFLISIFLVLITPLSAPAQKVLKESIRSNEKNRTYYLFVPDKIDVTTQAPLIILLHGSGRNGLSLIDKWKDFAKKEGFILVGPDSLNSQDWKVPEDGPDFIYELVESLKTKYPINPRRVYLFGHSGGAVIALYFSLLESEYFAATAIHAGSLKPDDGPLAERSKRKIPIAIFVGTDDQFFPLTVVRATRDLLNGRGFKVELTEIKNHTHMYYDRADEINQKAWGFLKSYELGEDPKYEHYRWPK